VKVLVTGHAGFIGFHVASRLLARGDAVVGIDSVNAYYDPTLKERRLALLAEQAATSRSAYVSLRRDLCDAEGVRECFSRHAFDRVIHLAAQAGVRHSLNEPRAYVDSNVVGFLNVLEACRDHATPHLTYASTSSVYGGNRQKPFSEQHGVDHPLQLYAATKRANELMAHAYGHLFRLPTTGLRFFTVYGPWGRPDMALFQFTRAILAGEPIRVFNYGNQTRDFTYIDDIVEGVIRASDSTAQSHPTWDAEALSPAASDAPFRLLNIGHGEPVPLMDFIRAIELATGRKAVCEMLPAQPGDVTDTYADVSRLQRTTGYRPVVSVTEGVRRFVDWYREHYGLAGLGRTELLS